MHVSRCELSEQHAAPCSKPKPPPYTQYPFLTLRTGWDPFAITFTLIRSGDFVLQKSFPGCWAASNSWIGLSPAVPKPPKAQQGFPPGSQRSLTPLLAFGPSTLLVHCSFHPRANAFQQFLLSQRMPPRGLLLLHVGMRS